MFCVVCKRWPGDFWFLSAAIEDYQEAKEFDSENEEIKEGLEKAHKLLKQSKKRDYYKILGIRRYPCQLQNSFTCQGCC